jgi:hypothetical protein
MSTFLNTVWNADPDELKQLLQQSTVKTGFWNGRRLEHPKYSGRVTFSQFASQVENLYLSKMGKIQLRQQKYLDQSQSHIDPMPISGGRSMINLLFLPILLPYKLTADALCWIKTPYPEISEEEERELVPVLEWRQEIDALLDQKFDESQEEVNCKAMHSISGKVNKLWDKLFDRLSSWRNTNVDDEKILQFMKQNRQSYHLSPSARRIVLKALLGAVLYSL